MVETAKNEAPAETSKTSDLESQQWKLFVDNSSNKGEPGPRVMLVSLEEHKINCALHFEFQASNNEVEYEAYFVIPR